MCYEQEPPVDTRHLAVETESSVTLAWYHSGEDEPLMSHVAPRR